MGTGWEKEGVNAFGDIGTGWEEEGWVYRFRSEEEGGLGGRGCSEERKGWMGMCDEVRIWKC